MLLENPAISVGLNVIARAVTQQLLPLDDSNIKEANDDVIMSDITIIPLNNVFDSG